MNTYTRYMQANERHSTLDLEHTLVFPLDIRYVVHIAQREFFANPEHKLLEQHIIADLSEIYDSYTDISEYDDRIIRQTRGIIYYVSDLFLSLVNEPGVIDQRYAITVNENGQSVIDHHATAPFGNQISYSWNWLEFLNELNDYRSYVQECANILFDPSRLEGVSGVVDESTFEKIQGLFHNYMDQCIQKSIAQFASELNHHIQGILSSANQTAPVYGLSGIYRLDRVRIPYESFSWIDNCPLDRIHAGVILKRQPDHELDT